MMVGLISDTHGLLRESAVSALSGCELILHAGDVGRAEILEELRKIAPIVAVRGNVDPPGLPEIAEAECGGARFLIVHDVKSLKAGSADGFDFVVSGHSHQPSEKRAGRVVYVNPGSAGPRRFRLPLTVARVHLDEQPWRIEFVDVN
jgi:putative phosphoesterase